MNECTVHLIWYLPLGCTLWYVGLLLEPWHSSIPYDRSSVLLFPFRAYAAMWAWNVPGGEARVRAQLTAWCQAHPNETFRSMCDPPQRLVSTHDGVMDVVRTRWHTPNHQQLLVWTIVPLLWPIVLTVGLLWVVVVDACELSYSK